MGAILAGMLLVLGALHTDQACQACRQGWVQVAPYLRQGGSRENTVFSGLPRARAIARGLWVLCQELVACRADTLVSRADDTQG